MKRPVRTALVLGVLLLVWLMSHYLFGDWISLSGLKLVIAELHAFHEQSPAIMAAAFFLFYVVATATSLPVAALLALAAGALFGVMQGTIIVSFASTIGATLAMLASRHLFREWILARFGDRVHALNDRMVRDGAYYLFALRLVPSIPFVVVNLVMGLTMIRTRTFFWVSQLGMFGATIIYVNAGTQLATLDNLQDLLSPPILASFAALGLFPLAARVLVKRFWRV